MNPFRCGNCGKFISLSDTNAIAYIQFGTHFDLEPADEQYECGKCSKGELPNTYWQQRFLFRQKEENK